MVGGVYGPRTPLGAHFRRPLLASLGCRLCVDFAGNATEVMMVGV